MSDLPIVNTKQLSLRKIRSEDIPSLIKYCNNPKISDQIINIPYPYGEEEAKKRISFVLEGLEKGERYVFAITLKGTDELIGEIGLHLDKTNNSAQFGYWIGEPFWGKRIATEALAAILKFGFEQLNLNKIYATHYPENKASAKVMINNKMIKEAEMKEHYKVNNSYRDVIQYRLTKKEYLSLH
jgi:RimJ/RimL family protein N-acetyltransferase